MAQFVNSIEKIDYGLQMILLDLSEVQCFEYSEREYIEIQYKNGHHTVITYDQDEEDAENEMRTIFLDLYTKWRNYIDSTEPDPILAYE